MKQQAFIDSQFMMCVSVEAHTENFLSIFFLLTAQAPYRVFCVYFIVYVFILPTQDEIDETFKLYFYTYSFIFSARALISYASMKPKNLPSTYKPQTI
jgi:hypothetical protein